MANPPEYALSKVFNADDADIVIRSSQPRKDGKVTNFKVHLKQLANSPVFADMAEICKPQANADCERYDGLPVLTLPENEGTISNLLKLLYNGKHGFPNFEKLDENRMCNLLEATTKYDMPLARLAVENAILCVTEYCA